MNRTFKQLLIGLGVVTLLSATAIAGAQQPGMGNGKGEPPKDKEKMMDKLAKDLNLTAEQRIQMENHHKEHREKGKEIRKNLREKKSELREELEKPAVDKEKIKSLIDEITALTGAHLRENVEKTLKLKEILTPEQFEKFKGRIDRNFGQKDRDGKPKRGPKDRAERDDDQE